jgi:hypothetical protein
MHSSIAVLHNLINSKVELVCIKKRMNSEKEFSEKLLWTFLTKKIEEINHFLEENHLNETIDIDLQQELLFELAINFYNYDISDKFTQYLQVNNNQEFIENVAFLKATKNQIIQLERTNLKIQLNELDNETNFLNIIEIKSNSEQDSSKQNEKQKKIFQFSLIFKFAATLIITPIIVFFLFLFYKSDKFNLLTGKSKIDLHKQKEIDLTSSDSLKQLVYINSDSSLSKGIVSNENMNLTSLDTLKQLVYTKSDSNLTFEVASNKLYSKNDISTSHITFEQGLPNIFSWEEDEGHTYDFYLKCNKGYCENALNIIEKNVLGGKVEIRASFQESTEKLYEATLIIKSGGRTIKTITKIVKLTCS